MSLIADINQLHISIKSYFIGLALTMPFWFLDIFLFKPEIISDYDLYIPIVLSFCLTVCYFTLTIFSSVTFGMITEFGFDTSSTLVLSIGFSVFWLAGITYCGYIFGLTFIQFVNTIFTVAIVKAIFWVAFFFLRPDPSTKDKGEN